MGEEKFTDKRKINFEWVLNGVLEMCELYREQALRLVQDAEAESEEEIYQLVINQIREDISRVESLMTTYITRGVNKALNFEMPDFERIDPKKLLEISELSDEFRNKALSVFRSYSFEERMNESPFLLGGVMRCIVDLRKKIHQYNESNLEEVSFKEFNDEELKKYPTIAYLRKDLSPLILKEIVIAVIRSSNLRSIRALGLHLNLTVDLYKLFSRKSVPQDAEQKTAYIKVWNWTIENILEQVGRKDGLSVRTERAIQRAR